MGYARSHTVPADISGIYHCYSRCVRRERLIESLDRVALLERRLAFLSTRVFAVDLIEFKPMGNHLHIIVRVHPELAWCWTDEEVARRWLLLSLAGRRPDLEDNEGPSDETVAALVEEKPKIDECRRRLSNLGAYHSAWREWTAKRWNREDRVSGHFWQGRYGVTTALDDAAVLTQSTYVLLNAVHAGLEDELGMRTRGSLKTRMKRLIEKASREARERVDSNASTGGGLAGPVGPAGPEAFDRDFVHASWTPVYPCDPGSAADLDDEAFAKRVADGRHQASHRASLREDGLALAHFATRGEREDVERVAWELRDPGRVSDGVPDEVPHRGSDGASHGQSLPTESEPQRRPRPTNAPRHPRYRRQPSPTATAAPRTILKPDASDWLKPMANPFHASRLVDGAVPVIPGMTLGMLIDFADEEGRHPRPDKSGAIARSSERAIVSLRREFLDEVEGDGEKGAENRASRSHADLTAAAAADSYAATHPVVAVARKLAASVRSAVAKLVSSVTPSVLSESRASGRNGSATEPHQPIAMTPRGSAFGTRESLRAEAARRGGTSVHAVRLQLTSRE
jgi:hypothetical protein